MIEVRAITVREPWASPIVDGYKTVENRSAGFQKHYRGLVLVHTSKVWSRRGHHDPRVCDAYPSRADNSPGYVLRHGVAYGGRSTPRPPWPFIGGAIIGQVELVDVHPAAGCCRPWGEDEYADAKGQTRTDVVHLVLEQPVRYERPVTDVRGTLGLWRPRPELALKCGLDLADS